MRPFDYSILAPGIRDTVRWCHSKGFRTSDSGDGKTNADAGMECAWDRPMVAIDHVAFSFDWKNAADLVWYEICAMNDREAVEGVHVEASYSPMDGHTLVLVTGLDDQLLRSLPGWKDWRDRTKCP